MSSYLIFSEFRCDLNWQPGQPLNLSKMKIQWRHLVSSYNSLWSHSLWKITVTTFTLYQQTIESWENANLFKSVYIQMKYFNLLCQYSNRRDISAGNYIIVRNNRYKKQWRQTFVINIDLIKSSLIKLSDPPSNATSNTPLTTWTTQAFANWNQRNVCIQWLFIMVNFNAQHGFCHSWHLLLQNQFDQSVWLYRILKSSAAKIVRYLSLFW